MRSNKPQEDELSYPEMWLLGTAAIALGLTLLVVFTL